MKIDNSQIAALKRKAEQGDANAQFELGKMCEEGKGVEQDWAEALKWYLCAAEKGHMEADKSYHGLLDAFRGIAYDGNTGAQFMLGKMYEQGKGVEQDNEIAYEWYLLAANRGDDIEAQYNLGELHYSGKSCVGPDYQYVEAMLWYKGAAERGHAGALYRLGEMYECGRGIERDYAQAVEYYELAAKYEHVEAQYRLGQMYEDAMGVERDCAKAAEWYRLAAKQGHSGAQYGLGMMHGMGIGVEENYVEAANLFRLAAEQGNVCAQHNLGGMYRKGEGVEQNYAESVKWYRLAAGRGLAMAQSDLGVMYSQGKGVPQDYAEALRWLHLAAEQNYANAQINIGLFYFHAMGVAKNYREAYIWFCLAEANESEKAVKIREIAKKELTAVDLKFAQEELAKRMEETEKKTGIVAPVFPPAMFVAFPAEIRPLI